MEGLSRLIHPETFDQGHTRAWWDEFPKAPHYALENYSIFDFRFISLGGARLEGISLSQSCLDGIDAERREASIHRRFAIAHLDETMESRGHFSGGDAASKLLWQTLNIQMQFRGN